MTPGLLKETVFGGKENYKLKYNAAQARLFLKLLPFLLSSFVEPTDEYLLFLIELLKIVNLLYSPLIKIETVQVLKQLIYEHLFNLLSLLMLYDSLILYDYSSWSSAHNYFKQLAPKT